MRNRRRKIAFVLAASDHGTMIVNRFDERNGIGVGFQIHEDSSFDLALRRQYFGDGVMALDCGANRDAPKRSQWRRHISEIRLSALHKAPTWAF